MEFKWSAEKNVWLRTQRSISFEDVVVALATGNLLATRRHHNTDRYAHQEIYFVDVKGYVYMVPFVREKQWIFLKTVIPTRKGTREFMQEIKG